MKILQVVNNLAYGGLEKLVVDLSAGLRELGHESLICCLEGTGPLEADAQARGIQVIVLDKRVGPDVGLLGRLASRIRREQIDVVHTHNMGPLLYGSLAGRLAGVRWLVNTRHGREDKRRPAWVWGLNAAVVAISTDAKRRLLEHNRIDARRVRVIYNGIDAQAFNGHPADVWRRGLGTGPVIGTIARLATEKDQNTLLQGFARMAKRVPHATLAIVGDGEQRPHLEKMSRTLRVDDRVKFLGFRQDVKELVGAFDVFVLSSLTEGVPLTLLEAMASRRPVVATRVGGIPEVVVDGQTGFLVPPQDPEALAAAMTRCVTEPTLAMTMGEAGHQRVEARFSLKRMAQAYAELYEHLSDHESLSESE